MNNIDKILLKVYSSTPNFKLILVYLLFGCFIILGSNREISYINMIYFASGNIILISFFLIPCVILLGYNVFDQIEQNKALISRFNTKKEYYYFQIRMIFKITTRLFLWFIFIILICTNLFADRSHFILNDPNYKGVNNIVGMIVSFIKLYIFLLIFQFFNICLKKKINVYIIVITNFAVLYTLYDYLSFQSIKYIGFIFPSRYIGFSYIYESFTENVVYSFIYLISLLVIGFFIAKQIIIKKDIEG